MQTYLTIVTQPLLWVFLGLLAGFYLILWAVSLDVRRLTPRTIWLRRHYPAVILTGVAILAIIALTFYLIEIGISVRILVDRLRAAAADPDSEVGDLQSLASAVAILIGVLAAAATILYSSIRVWINERTATATEEGLITDRINKAVQGLGAEKVVNRLGRTVRFKVDGVDGSYFEWIDQPGTPPPNPDVIDGKVQLTNDPWSSFPDTQPNLEVRIGSIYALERIAQDSDRDHVQVMEILCAYVRQNAPVDLADPFPEEWRDALETKEVAQKAKPPSRDDIWEWAKKLKPPREDIQVALTVLVRRSKRQIALEGHFDSKGDWQGYRIDLRHTCLQRADLRKAAFDHADLSGAQFQGARLWEARMQWAYLSEARMQGADFREARMQGAYFNGARMQGARLWEARMQGAYLSGAQMQGADLSRARMDGTTTLRAATLRGVAMREVDCSDVNISQNQIDSIFGDQTVILPEGLTRPDWPAIAEDDWREFHDQWRAWQKSIGFDPDDPATW